MLATVSRSLQKKAGMVGTSKPPQKHRLTKLLFVDGEDGDGFAVVRAMRKAHPNCIAILLTGYPAFESAVQAIQDEVDGYFVKPADINSLVSTIERKLRSR